MIVFLVGGLVAVILMVFGLESDSLLSLLLGVLVFLVSSISCVVINTSYTSKVTLKETQDIPIYSLDATPGTTSVFKYGIEYEQQAATYYYDEKTSKGYETKSVSNGDNTKVYINPSSETPHLVKQFYETKPVSNNEFLTWMFDPLKVIKVAAVVDTEPTSSCTYIFYVPENSMAESFSPNISK